MTQFEKFSLIFFQICHYSPSQSSSFKAILYSSYFCGCIFGVFLPLKLVNNYFKVSFDLKTTLCIAKVDVNHGDCSPLRSHHFQIVDCFINEESRNKTSKYFFSEPSEVAHQETAFHSHHTKQD